MKVYFFGHQIGTVDNYVPLQASITPQVTPRLNLLDCKDDNDSEVDSSLQLDYNRMISRPNQQSTSIINHSTMDHK